MTDSTNETFFYANGRKHPLFVDPGVLAVRFQPGKHSDHTASLVARRMLQTDAAQTDFIAKYGIQVFRFGEGRPGSRVEHRVRELLSELSAEPSVEFATRAYRESEFSPELMFVTRRFIAQFRPEVPWNDAEQLNARHGVKIIEELDYAPRAYVLEAPSDGGDKGAVAIANAYYESGLVTFAHPDFIRRREVKTMHTEVARAKPRHVTRARATVRAETDEQWHLAQIRAFEAWKVTRGKPSIRVAVLDDGIDVAHDELHEKVVAQHDFETDEADGRPKTSDERHGTACAGVAVARGLRASGSAPGCALIAIRTPLHLGVDDEARMFKFAADSGADIITCSWGPPDNRGAFPLVDNVAAAITYCATQGRKGLGIPIFFAAGNGNESVSDDGYASNPHVMAIAASTDNGTRAPYSDYGREIFLCAPSSGGAARVFTSDRMGASGYNPGDATLGDAAGNYTARFGGTSSAAPLVAGVAALMLSVNDKLTSSDVRRILAKTAERIGATTPGEYAEDWEGLALTRSRNFGYGRVNAHDAVLAAQSFEAPSPAAPVEAPSRAGTVSAPATVLRTDGPPTFQINAGEGRFFVLEVGTSSRALEDKPNDPSVYFAPWNEHARSGTSYTLPSEAWAALRGASRIYYRLWTSARADAWVDRACGDVHALDVIDAVASGPLVFPSGASFDPATPADNVDRS
ncbi:MAG TPA: S8 family serine peptidase, partial [Labilithrix sp.]|nr:S8 family serine peptidase [Labilithrix sp.]